VKKTEERIGRRLEFGLRVKGTGVGEKVRGKISERGLKNRYVVLNFLCCLEVCWDGGWEEVEKRELGMEEV
jgi:hypothetical protein